MNSKKHPNKEYQSFLQRKVEAGRADMVANMGHLNEEVEAEFAKRRAALNPKPQ
ncbi:MAG: hypothetical protein ACK4SX_05005 [Alcanivoracaceae bacterium]